MIRSRLRLKNRNKWPDNGSWLKVSWARPIKVSKLNCILIGVRQTKIRTSERLRLVMICPIWDVMFRPLR